MKKTFVFVAAVTCAFAVSCSKSEQPPAIGETQTLTASVPSDDLSRVSADGVHVLWNQGDRLSLFDGGTASAGAVYETAVSEPSSTAVFTGTGAQLIDGKYYAFYPNDPDWLVSWNKDGDGLLRFMIPAVQYARVNNFPKNGVPMIASGTADAMVFKHLAAYISFEIGDNAPSNIVKVMLGGGGAKTSACFSVDYLNDGTPKFADDGVTNDVVTLCNEDDTPLVKGIYYVAVRPRTWSGVSMTLVDDAGHQATVSHSGSINLATGRIQHIGEVRNINFASIAIGDIYKEDEIAKGIVVAVDSDSYKVMSLDGENLKWTAETVSVFQEDLSSNRNDGSLNMAIIKAWPDYSPESYPAVGYCDEMGEDWYLPASKEMMSLMANMDFMNNEKYQAFDKKITDAGGKSLGSVNTEARFLCSDSNQGANDPNKGAKVYYTYFKGDAIKSTTGSTTQSRGVRCIKKVSL